MSGRSTSLCTGHLCCALAKNTAKNQRRSGPRGTKSDPMGGAIHRAGQQAGCQLGRQPHKEAARRGVVTQWPPAVDRPREGGGEEHQVIAACGASAQGMGRGEGGGAEQHSNFVSMIQLLWGFFVRLKFYQPIRRVKDREEGRTVVLEEMDVARAKQS